MRNTLLLMSAFTLLALRGCMEAGPGDAGPRHSLDFNMDWKFMLADDPGASRPAYDDSGWRSLHLPHDWSIDGTFSRDHPATVGGGALPGGTGWYRKTFSIPGHWKGKKVFIDFDGIYRDSEVWINGEPLGRRPNGYISFRYELTGRLNGDGTDNVLAVRVDNSMQPNSRWYSGSGIYRQVRLVAMEPLHFGHWDTFITTPLMNEDSALVKVSTVVRNDFPEPVDAVVIFSILDPSGREIASLKSPCRAPAEGETAMEETLAVLYPQPWSVHQPHLYCLVTEIWTDGVLVDREKTDFGIRTFSFHAETGFTLNGTRMKIRGVCNHHDLGALGAAAFPRAMERQLEILKEMGCNAIRTAHNPPSPVLLDLCDRMGFLVMDETFDMWKRGKTAHDYHMYWDRWHERDLSDHIRRDRNHPSVIMWSIGNEILEQWHPEGEQMAQDLAAIVRKLDPSRPVTSGCNHPSPENSILRSGAVDIVGFNYQLDHYDSVPDHFPGMPFVASETTSALATRGSYDMPSDVVRVWPERWDKPFHSGNPDQTCSAYDNCHVPWGSTHAQALLDLENRDYVSGIFVWTGFDYLGEPTPYSWPSRSSYFGIIDLAGFPKDAYYLYKSRWTSEPVLHVFPHWNHNMGDTVDVWAYTSCPEVELFLNGTSLGKRSLPAGKLHMKWRVPYEPGWIAARGMHNGEELLARIETSGPPAQVRLTADREVIGADPMDLSFVTVEIVDEKGRVVPDAARKVTFRVDGPGSLEAVDNGLQTSLEPFRASGRTTFNGKALAIVRSAGQQGVIGLSAFSEGLAPANLNIKVEFIKK